MKMTPNQNHQISTSKSKSKASSATSPATSTISKPSSTMITSKKTIAKTKKWTRKNQKQSLVGKMWEIYWDPNQTQKTIDYRTSTSTSTSTSTCTPPSRTSTDDEDELDGSLSISSSDLDFDADWYDAHIKSYIPESDEFEILFVGEEEKVYKMALEPSLVRPIHIESDNGEGSEDVHIHGDSNGDGNGDGNGEDNGRRHAAATTVPQHQVDSEWRDHILHKDWEVFWDSSSSDKMQTDYDHTIEEEKDDDDDNDDDASFYSDWYDAKINSYSPETGLFHVSFLGEAQPYAMTLTPNNVRPSAMAWVRRTKFLLDMTADQVLDENRQMMNLKCVRTMLPQSTERLEDVSSNEHGCGTGTCTGSVVEEKSFDMSHYRELLEEQLELKAYLQFTSPQHDEEVKNKGMVPNGREHVEYLEERIRCIIQACSWHEKHTWEVFSRDVLRIRPNHGDAIRSMSDAEEDEDLPLITIQNIYSRIFNGVVHYIRTLAFDCDQNHKVKKRRKRPIPPSCTGGTGRFPLSSKRVKKRRLAYNNLSMHTGCEEEGHMRMERDALMDEISECEREVQSITDVNVQKWNHLLQILNDQFGRTSKWGFSSQMVENVIRHFSGSSPRYFSNQLSASLVLLLDRAWNHFAKWMVQVRRALGTTFATELMDVENTIIESLNEEHVDSKEGNEESCSLQDLTSCLTRCREQKIMKRMDLSLFTDFLEQKLNAINLFQERSWEAVAIGLNAPIEFPSDVSEYDREDIGLNDAVVLKLQNILKNPACPHSSTCQTTLTKGIITQAISLRKWIVLVKWVSSRRERFGTIKYVMEHRPPNIIQFPKKYAALFNLEEFDTMVAQLDRRWDNIQKHSLNKSLNEADCERICRKKLAEWSDGSALLPVEEEAAALADICAWNDIAKRTFPLPSTQADFDLISSLYRDLQNIRKGKSMTRLKLTNGLLGDAGVDLRIQAFTKEHISTHCRDMEVLVTDLYNTGTIWCKRSNHVLKSLKYYGNDTVDISLPSNSSTKVNNLVDLKQIDDLIEEHRISAFVFSDLVQKISSASENAHKWLDGMLDLIPKEDESNKCIQPSTVLQALHEKCRGRPKGIVMFPSRQVVGEWVELLEWYKTCNDTFKLLRSFHEKKSSPEGEFTDHVLDISETNKKVEDLLAKGLELVLAAPSFAGTSINCRYHIDLTSFASKKCLKSFQTESSSISPTRFESCRYSIYLLRALLGYDYNLDTNGVFFNLKLFAWRYQATDFLTKIDEYSYRRVKRNLRPTVDSMKKFLQPVERLPTSLETLSKKDCLIASIYSSKYLPLLQLVHDAEKVATEVVGVLDEISNERTEITSEYVGMMSSKLKSVRSSIKSVNEGLGVESALSNEIEKKIRELNWMKSVITCPIIRDPRYSSARRGVNASDALSEEFSSDEGKVPLSHLVQLYDKAPSQCRSMDSDNLNFNSLETEMSNLFKRLSSVKNQFSNWQAEVYTYIPRTLRLTKRRDTQSRYLGDGGLDSYDIVTEETLKKLLEHPLLRYVSMPEEEVIHEALNQTITMRDRFQSIFGKDHFGRDADRSALPSYASLLGDSGEFFLYKVVHHPVYFKLRSELTAMESCADNLSVCTLEKITYVWLVKTMKWIEAVSSAVYVPNAGSLLTKLCIPFDDAMRLIDEGHKIFFGLTDESKKYMLKYRLSVVTRSSTGKVFVKNCKGGSNHSAGGTVLRWISFCYSGLRNDLASTTYWMRRAETFLDNKTIETDLFKSSSELAEEAEESLVVAPKMELLEKIANVLKENSPVPKKATFAVDGKPEFIHNLLMNNDTTKDDTSDNEYPGDNKAAGPTDDSNS